MLAQVAQDGVLAQVAQDGALAQVGVLVQVAQASWGACTSC